MLLNFGNVATTEIHLPLSYRANYQPGIAFKSKTFSSIHIPWVRFTVYIYPKSTSEKNKRNISLLVKVDNPYSLYETEIESFIKITAIGELRNKRLNTDIKKTLKANFNHVQTIFGWNSFVSRQELFDKYPLVMKKGRFIVRVNINFEFKKSPIPYSKSLYGKPDCYVKINYGKIYVHSELLKQHSLVFNQKHYENPNIEIFAFVADDPYTVYAALQFIYTGLINEEIPENKLLEFARKNGFHELQKILEETSLHDSYFS